MSPNSLIGKVFTIPVFSALSQQNTIKEIEESKMPGHWVIKLEWIPSSYSVPSEISILVNPVVNNKMMFTMLEKNDKSHTGTYTLSKQIVNRDECGTINGLQTIFEKLGTF